MLTTIWYLSISVLPGNVYNVYDVCVAIKKVCISRWKITSNTAAYYNIICRYGAHGHEKKWELILDENYAGPSRGPPLQELRSRGYCVNTKPFLSHSHWISFRHYTPSPLLLKLHNHCPPTMHITRVCRRIRIHLPTRFR